MPSTRQKWIPKDDAPKWEENAAVSSKGRPQRGAGAAPNSNASSAAAIAAREIAKRGPKPSRSAPEVAKGKAQPQDPRGDAGANHLSKDEVQQGLSMILQQLKGGTQDESVTDMSSGAAPKKQEEQPGVLLLQQLQSGPKKSTTGRKVRKMDVGAAVAKKTYGRKLMLRAHACLLRWPEGGTFNGPMYSVAPRPLELSTSLEFDDAAAGAMPPTPPPSAPPSFGISSLNAPVFEPAPSWDVSSAAALNAGYTMHDATASGYMFPGDGAVPWEVQAYYGDSSGFHLPEVPVWPTEFTEPSIPPSFGSSAEAFVGYRQRGKADGQDLEDVESTAASSGQPSSVSQSPLSTQYPVGEVQARIQVEYYLSADNLSRDYYLRSLLDEDGWVSLEVVANFPRMRRIGLDATAVAAALMGSAVVEVSWDTPPRARTTSPESLAKFSHTEGAGTAPALMEQPEETPVVGTAC